MSTRTTLQVIALFVACLCFVPSKVPGSQANVYTRAEAALDIATHFKLPHTEDAQSLYGLAHTVFPGGYDGKDHLSYHDQPCTLEVLIVALVRYSGWDVLHYSSRLAEIVRPYVSPEGIPWYGPDPTSRSIPSVVIALEKGVLERERLGDLRKPISRAEALGYMRKLDDPVSLAKAVPPVRWLTVDECRDQKSLSASLTDASQMLVIPKEAPHGDLVGNLPNPIMDLRAPGMRLLCGPTELNSGRQDYFPLGSLQTILTASLGIPADSYIHQGESIYGRVENSSTTANAVGIWAASLSRRAKARVWGGFLTAENSPGDDRDAQLVGLEVDVTNKSLPGVSPNASKVGIQVVGIGHRVTNAIEIIGSEDGLWQNGLNFAERSVSPEGTVIALTQPAPVNYGIDFTHTPFRTAAVAISNNSLLGFCSKSGGLSGMYADDVGDGHLVLRTGQSGLRVTDHLNSQNLLHLTPQGDLVVKGRVLSESGHRLLPSADKVSSQHRVIVLLSIITCLNSTALLALLGGWLWRRRAVLRNQAQPSVIS